MSVPTVNARRCKSEDLKQLAGNTFLSEKGLWEVSLCLKLGEQSDRRCHRCKSPPKWARSWVVVTPSSTDTATQDVAFISWVLVVGKFASLSYKAIRKSHSHCGP